MNIKRCQYIVSSKNIKGQKYNRKCRNSQHSEMKIFSKNCYCYCFLHTNIIYKNYVNIIIKYFKGFYIRKKIHYYKLLPCDVQYKIIYKMRENFYIDHYNCSISKILHNRLKSFNDEIRDSTITNQSLTDLFIKSLFNKLQLNDGWANDITNKMLELFKLFNKYKLIINKKTEKILNYLVFCSNTINMYYWAVSFLNFSDFQHKFNTIMQFNKNFYHLKFI